MVTQHTGFLTRLARDKSGNILPLAAAGVVLIATMIGGGVDMSRVYMAKNQLQAACDAAALAGRRAVVSNGYDATAKAQASSYFNVNFDETQQGTHGTVFSSSSADSGNRVNGTATTTVDMLLMQLFGYDDQTVTVACTSTMGVGNSDVTMVLDVTSSMDQTLSGSTQTRIQALRAAMKNFYTTVKTATNGSNARIRYSFVPYSSSVNVGALLYAQNPAYIRSSSAIQSRVAVYVPGWSSPSTTNTITYSTVQTGSQTTYNSTTYSNNTSGLNSCNSARPTPNPTAWTNNGSSSTGTPSVVVDGSGNQVTTTVTTQPQKRTNYLCKLNSSNPQKYQIYKYDETRNELNTQKDTRTPIQVFDHWDYKQITYNTATYKTSQSVTTLTGGTTTPTNVSSTWNGCIEERKTTNASAGSFSYSSLLGMSPSDAWDLDLDKVPDTDPNSQWAPMWPALAYYRTTTDGGSTLTNSTSYYGKQAAAYCPSKAQLLTTMTQTEFNTYADNLGGGGYTYHDIGLIWGGRLSSPDGLFQANVNIKPNNGGSVARHLIFMTDGQMCPFNTAYSSYGVEYHDRRVTTNGGSTLFCDNAGNDAAYATYSGLHAARFRAVCDAIKAKGIRIWVIVFASATTTDLTYCASTNSAFTASNSTQLNSAFQEIAKQVGELRMVE